NIKRLEKGHSLGDTLFELVECDFSIVELGWLDSCKTRRAIFGLVTGNLDLAAKREHVGSQAPTKQDRRIDLLRRRVSGRLSSTAVSALRLISKAGNET